MTLEEAGDLINEIGYGKIVAAIAGSMSNSMPSRDGKLGEAAAIDPGGSNSYPSM
jgi:hypothetical protein